MKKRSQKQSSNPQNNPTYFVNQGRNNVFEQSIQIADSEQNQMIQNQINHLIVTTTLTKMFTILEKSYKYSFVLMKNILRLQPTTFQRKLTLMTKILSSKTNGQKNRFLTILKDYYIKYQTTVAKGFSIIEIALNKKIINLKVNAFQEMLKKSELEGQKLYATLIGQKTLEDKINDYLIEIVKLYMTITVNNIQRYKKFLISDVFQQIKLFSSYKRAQEKKIEIQHKCLKKIASVISIQDLFVKNQFRSKIKAFKVLKTNQFHQNQHYEGQDQIDSQNVNDESQNPQLPIYVSSIKSMITTLNKFEQKEKAKIHSQKQISAILTIQKFLQTKELVLKKSSFYTIFDSIDYQQERDRLEVLERQVMALKQDMEDL